MTCEAFVPLIPGAILLTVMWLLEWNYLVYAGPIRSEESVEGDDDSGAVYSRCLVGRALCLTAVW